MHIESNTLVVLHPKEKNRSCIFSAKINYEDQFQPISQPYMNLCICILVNTTNINQVYTHTHIYIYTHTHTHTQGVPGGMCQTSGECFLC